MEKVKILKFRISGVSGTNERLYTLEMIEESINDFIRRSCNVVVDIKMTPIVYGNNVDLHYTIIYK